jgi:hypothetical protein
MTPSACRRFSSAGLVSIAAIASAADLSEASLRAADAEQMRIIVEGDADKQRTFMQLHGSKILDRRFTNVFVFEDGEWRFLARQATIVAVR